MDGWMDEYAALVEWFSQRKTKVLRQNPTLVPLGQPKISHELDWVQMWASMVTGQQLTTCPKALPHIITRDKNKHFISGKM